MRQELNGRSANQERKHREMQGLYSYTEDYLSLRFESHYRTLKLINRKCWHNLTHLHKKDYQYLGYTDYLVLLQIYLLYRHSFQNQRILVTEKEISLKMYR